MKDSTYNNPRSEFASFVVLVSLLCVLCGISSAQNFQTVHPGVEYAQVDHKIANDPVKINLLRLDLTKVRIDVHHALDAAIGTEKTSSIATRHGAVAAINAGFFRLDNSIFAGDATGVLSIDNELMSESINGRVALMIDNRIDRSDVYIERANISNMITIRKENFEVGINRERKEDEIVIYTKGFGVTTLTRRTGTEFVVRKKKIKAILDNAGSTPIPSDGYVISATGKARDRLRSVARRGTRVVMRTHHSSPTEVLPGPGFGRSSDIVGGVPLLIKDGRIAISWEQEKSSKLFVEMRHPRTAVAKMKDGKFLMITVDGRQPGVSVGMTLQEVAEYLLSLGATDAMNLDGGGSTAMFLDGKIVNTPSDKDGERKVSDAILVTLRTNAQKR